MAGSIALRLIDRSGCWGDLCEVLLDRFFVGANDNAKFLRLKWLYCFEDVTENGAASNRVKNLLD